MHRNYSVHLGSDFGRVFAIKSQADVQASVSATFVCAISLYLHLLRPMECELQLGVLVEGSGAELFPAKLRCRNLF